MKIGIATFQWSDNYGAVLQAQALQGFLQVQGHEVDIINFCRPRRESFLRRYVAKSPAAMVRKWERRWKIRKFEQFRERYFKLTPETFFSASDLREIADRYEVLITGSDQVWNPRWLEEVSGFFDLYFLSFAGPRTRRISYAASIGHADVSTMTEDWRGELSDRLKKMDAISVREPSAIALVEALSGRNDAVSVADPTLLMDRIHYERLAGNTRAQAPYLFSYMLHGLDEDFRTQTNGLSARLGADVLKCNAKWSSLRKGYDLPSPCEWLRRIRDAEFVVTNSFHATIFCLIFHVPFVTVLIDGSMGAMNARIVDLLEAVGLRNRMISVSDSVNEGWLKDDICWAKVDQGLARLKRVGMDFLKKQELYRDE